MQAANKVMRLKNQVTCLLLLLTECLQGGDRGHDDTELCICVDFDFVIIWKSIVRPKCSSTGVLAAALNRAFPAAKGRHLNSRGNSILSYVPWHWKCVWIGSLFFLCFQVSTIQGEMWPVKELSNSSSCCPRSPCILKQPHGHSTWHFCCDSYSWACFPFCFHFGFN